MIVLGQTDGKESAAFRTVGGDNLSALGLDKAFDNCQAQTAASGGRRRCPKEFVENFGQKFLVEVAPLSVTISSRKLSRCRASMPMAVPGWRVNGRVEQEIGKRLLRQGEIKPGQG